jgi:hypothetical protein
MSHTESMQELARSLIEDPEYVRALTERLQTRTADPALVKRLVAYARGRQATLGQAIARRVLTAAGVSWEAVNG